MMSFEFYKSGQAAPRSGSFLIQIPPGIGARAELFTVFAREANFPGYFGMNWDAFDECILDLSWITERVVTVIHQDIPMHNTDDSFIYMDTLKSASDAWNSLSGAGKLSPLIPHEFYVLFPDHLQNEIRLILD